MFKNIETKQLARGGMLRGEERKSDRNRRGKVFRTQGTTATPSLCRSGGEIGVREKKRVGDDGKKKGKKSTSSHHPPRAFFLFWISIRQLHISNDTPCLPQIFCISFVFNFSCYYCNTQWLCKRLGANKVYNGRCANGNKFINFPFSGSLRGLKNLILSTDSQLSIRPQRPSLGIREEERGGQGTFAVSPFRSLLLQILILGWSTVSQSPYGGQSIRFELRSPTNATPTFLFRN